jgi:hypothetical protein
MSETRNARIKIGIRPVVRGNKVHIVQTKRVVWRDAVAWIEGGKVMDSAGEVWEVKPFGNGDFEAIG